MREVFQQSSCQIWTLMVDNCRVFLCFRLLWSFIRHNSRRICSIVRHYTYVVLDVFFRLFSHVPLVLEWCWDMVFWWFSSSNTLLNCFAHAFYPNYATIKASLTEWTVKTQTRYIGKDMRQGGHKPGKLREYEKLSKSQGRLRNFEFL